MIWLALWAAAGVGFLLGVAFGSRDMSRLRTEVAVLTALVDWLQEEPTPDADRQAVERLIQETSGRTGREEL